MVHPVRHKVAQAFKLKLLVGQGVGQGRLHDGGDNFQAVGAQALQKVFAAGVGLFVAEQAVVHAHFRGYAVMGAYPGDDALDLDAGRAGRAALGVGDQGGVHFRDVAVGVFLGAGAFDDVAVFEPHLVAGEQAKKTSRGRFFKVAAFDPHLAPHHELSVAQLGVVRVHGGAAGV